MLRANPMDFFSGKENERNWIQRDQALTEYITLLEKGDTEKISSMFAKIRMHYFDILLVIHTPRTQLALRCLKFIQLLAASLPKDHFEMFTEVTMEELAKLCGTTKKLIANMAELALFQVFLVSNPAKISFRCLAAMAERNASMKTHVLTAFLRYSKRSDCAVFNKCWSDVETLIIKAIGDANSHIRMIATEIIRQAEKYSTQDVAKYNSIMNPNLAG